MNPELQRNLWLEATRRQIASAAVLLGLIFVLVWLLGRGRDAHDFVLAGGLVFVVAGLLWGSREARASVVHEVYNRTWDFQRLSALSPWTLTWGKLVGATSRPWMFAGVALAVAFLQLASISSVAHALFWALVGLGCAVFLQASGMAVGLIEIRKARALGRLPGLRSPGLSLLLLVLAGLGLSVWRRTHPFGLHGFGLDGEVTPLFWWNVGYDRTGFAAASLVALAAFAVLWAWRLMRLELQLNNAPWAWLLFVAGAGLYAAGFGTLLWFPPPQVRLGWASAAFAACAYVAAFVEPADRVQLRRFAAAVARFDVERLWWSLPTPIVPALLAVLSALTLSTMLWRQGEFAPSAFGLALVAFFLRDLGLIAGLRLSPHSRRSDFSVIAALLLTYVIGGLVGRVLAGRAGAALFVPSLRAPALSLAAGLGEAVLAWAFAAWRVAHNASPPLVRPQPAPPSQKPATVSVPVTEPPADGGLL